MKPTVGRIVHYMLNEGDVTEINAQRDSGNGFRTAGNEPHAGDVYPATVVRVWPSETGCSNLQVHLDGPDAYWATSREQVATDSVDQKGHWFWPPRE